MPGLSPRLSSARRMGASPEFPASAFRQTEAAYILSETQVRSPHLHSNMWKVRPVGWSGMLVVNRGCSPHFTQGGDDGSLRLSCFSIASRNAEKNLPAS